MTKKFLVFLILFIVSAISASCAHSHPSPNHRPTHGDFQRPKNINQFPELNRFQEKFTCEPEKDLSDKTHMISAHVYFLDINKLADYNEAVTVVYFSDPIQKFAVRHIFEDAGPPTARFNFTKEVRMVYVESEKGWTEVQNEVLINKVLENTPNEYLHVYKGWDKSIGLSGASAPRADMYKKLVESSGCSTHDMVF